MADLDKYTVTIEFSAEMRQAFADLNARLEKLEASLSLYGPAKFKIKGADLVAVTLLADYRAGRANEEPPLLPLPS